MDQVEAKQVPVDLEDEDIALEEMTDDEYEALEPIEKVRTDLDIDENVDPLKALLSVDKNEITAEYPISRLKTKFTVRAISDDNEYEKMMDRCTQRIPRRGRPPQEKLDVRKLARLVVASYVTAPAFDPRVDRDSFVKLATHYGFADPENTDPEKLVSRALLPGEIDALSDFILRLSGFDDELVNTAGN